MNVKSEKGEIGIELIDKEGVEITNKSFSLKKLKNADSKLKYGNFLKSAKLLANKGEEQEIEGHVTTDDIEIKPFQVLSDAELLKACENRTAHKGKQSRLSQNLIIYLLENLNRCTTWLKLEWKIAENS